MGTRQDGQLVAQGKDLEEVSTRRQPESDRSEDRNDPLYRAWHGYTLCQRQIFFLGRDIGDGQPSVVVTACCAEP